MYPQSFRKISLQFHNWVLDAKEKAALLLQKGRNIPPEEREEAIKRIQAILNDEMLLRRPLDPPNNAGCG